MHSRQSHSTVFLTFLGSALALIVGAAPLAQSATPLGAATPQEAVATLKKAADAKDMLAALPVISPAGLKQIANEGVTGLFMVVAFADPDDRMPGDPEPPKAELDQKRKQYKELLGVATAVLKPYGLDALIDEPVLADATQTKINAALDKADNLGLITSLYAAIVKVSPLLGMTEPPQPDPPVRIGTVTGYEITGDTATARNDSGTLNFTRIDGRWFVEPSASAAGGSQEPAESGLSKTASGEDPEIVVGGIQIARVAVSNDDFSAKPFNSDNGTKIVLWVKMPAGQGLIEIDEDASVLAHFGDDKGTNLGGRFDSFPDEFKDGSGGTIEIESTGLPAEGAISLTAEGSLAMTVAAATSKTRVPNVALKNDAEFTFGKTPITITDVEVDDDSVSFTLNLPRQVMAGISNVVFLDAKDQPVESSRTGSGYMNDAAEMGFRVETKATALTLEFEAWQGLRTIKVPFNVKAGIGMN